MQRNLLQAQQSSPKQDTDLQGRILLACECLKRLPQELMQYDEALTRQTIRQILVLDEDTLKIQFVDGTEVTQQMVRR